MTVVLYLVDAPTHGYGLFFGEGVLSTLSSFFSGDFGGVKNGLITGSGSGLGDVGGFSSLTASLLIG